MINIQNFDDNECFKWCLVRYLHPANHYPTGSKNTGKLFGDEIDFDEIFTQNIFTKLNHIGISVLGYGSKEKYPLYVSKNAF